ncbi:MAG: hypothetical protein PHX83_07575 [Acidobacteriia bacterium]|nr:hypothetical protein [Terriglobia bacterium]
MPKPRWRLVIALVILLATISANSAAPEQTKAFKGFEVIPLRNGPNEIDINGDGLKDLIFIAWRENYNAHGFDIITFYLQVKSDHDIQPKEEWYLVPFFDEGGVPDKTSLKTEMGADCILSDIRVIRPVSPKKGPVTIVVGIRDLGESYADEASIKFLVYELRYTKEGIPGKPPYYFQQSKTIPGQEKYCDINNAFQRELGLGWYRTDRKKE